MDPLSFQNVLPENSTTSSWFGEKINDLLPKLFLHVLDFHNCSTTYIEVEDSLMNFISMWLNIIQQNSVHIC